MADLTHGSLFTGIGGFDEGAESAGFVNVWNAEKDRFCNNYLKKRWPRAKQYGDVKRIGTGCERVNVISAGFPCQDISTARHFHERAGLYGAQSSLFFEVIRIVALLLPDYVVFENSPAILGGDVWDVFAALTKIGYMCEWRSLRASDFGYPHRRERVFIVAYPISERSQVCVFQPTEVIGIRRKWAPTEAYLRVSTGGTEQEGNGDSIRFTDVVPGFRNIIHAFGNAVMPAVAEYVFRCIKGHYGNQ